MAAAETSYRYMYPRMIGYTFSIVLHVTNIRNMLAVYKGDVLKDPVVKQFHNNHLRFLTVWNVYLQVFYLGLGLSCDVFAITNRGKDSTLLRTLKAIRDPLFSSIIWPFSCTIFTVFWTVFSYDRALILPPSVDKTITPVSNHIMHTSVLPIVLWEIIFRPRTRPTSHLGNLTLMNLFAACYIVVLVVAYIQQGVWVYPILDMLYGTIYFYVFIVISLISTHLCYNLQWYLTDLIWNGREDEKKLI